MGPSAIQQSLALQPAISAGDGATQSTESNSSVVVRQQTSTIAQRESGTTSPAKLSLAQLSERGALRQLLGHQPSNRAEFSQFVKDVVGPPAQTRVGKAVDKLLDFIQVNVGRAASTGRNGSGFIRLERLFESLSSAKHPSESREILQTIKVSLQSYANKNDGKVDWQGVQELGAAVDRLILSESASAVKQAGKELQTMPVDIPKLQHAVRSLVSKEPDPISLFHRSISDFSDQRSPQVKTIQKAMYEFARLEFQTENMDFLSAVSEFKKYPTAESAMHIFNHFIQAGREQKVNLTDEASSALKQVLLENSSALDHVDPGVFDEAVGEVVEMIRQSDVAYRGLKAMGVVD